MKKPEIEIQFDLYYDAMKLCHQDTEWFEAALNNRTTLKEIVKPVFGFSSDIVVNNYLKTKNIGEFLKRTTLSNLTENVSNFLFNPTSEDSKDMLINTVTNKTYDNAYIVKCLMEEYCDRTRDLFHAKISPFPDDALETTAPLRKFKIVKENSEEMVLMLDGNKVETLELSPWSKSVSDYFETRSKSKTMCRGYLSSNFLSESDYEFAKRQLVHLKEVFLPISFALQQENTYKILYKEKFVAHDGKKDLTIDHKGLQVFFIGKTEHV